MDFSRYLDSKCIRIGFKPASMDTDHNSNSKKSIIKEIVRLSKTSTTLEHIDDAEIEKRLWEREELSSTALTNGIAIPHCKITGIKDFVIGIITVPDGIDYDSYDKKPTKIFVFIIAPEDQRNSHLRILSNISTYLKEEHNIIKILQSTDAEELRSSFIRHTFEGSQLETERAHNMFHVFVQNENRFTDILEIFTEKSDSHVVVVDASNASNYLYKMPLFSSFWSDNTDKFSRIIVGVIPRLKALNAIQQLNKIMKEEGENPGIMVTMHEISYFSGKLNI